MSDEDRIAALEARIADLEKKIAERSDDKKLLATVRAKLVEWIPDLRRRGAL